MINFDSEAKDISH